MHGWRICLFGCWARYSFDSFGSVWRFMLSMALILLVFLILSVFHCLSQRRVGCGHALRVSPAVTRLTVYRRPQVMREKLGNDRSKLCVANGVFEKRVLRLLISDRDKIPMGHTWGIKYDCPRSS